MSAEISPGGAGEDGYFEMNIHLLVDKDEALGFADLLKKMGWDEDAEDLETGVA